MSQISIGDYTVELSVYPFKEYTAVDSEEKYDRLYLEEGEYSFMTMVAIKVSLAGEPLKGALIGATGGGAGVLENSFVTEPDRIVICCSDSVFSLSIPDLSLIWKTKADWATCFEIFKYQSDYIVHGEMDITRLGRDGQIIWQQSGADIFVCLDPNEAGFILTDQYILATDFENRKYKFDYKGNIID
ncbi:MAG TPA: hypothetical protein VIM89_24135 [Mucilaginibacter sp.]